MATKVSAADPRQDSGNHVPLTMLLKSQDFTSKMVCPAFAISGYYSDNSNPAKVATEIHIVHAVFSCH